MVAPGTNGRLFCTMFRTWFPWRGSAIRVMSMPTISASATPVGLTLHCFVADLRLSLLDIAYIKAFA
eukprot:2462670-Amphidinium_carterae.1